MAVTAIGLLTAIIAASIITLEMWLFSIKEGYCTTGWWKAKRYCACNTRQTETSFKENTRFKAAYTGSSFLATWAQYKLEQPCDQWRSWSSAFDGRGSTQGQGFIEFGIYAILAVSLNALTNYYRLADI